MGGFAMGTLGLSSLLGLGLIAAGIIPVGVRGVALFALCGFVWLFGLILKIGVAAR